MLLHPNVHRGVVAIRQDTASEIAYPLGESSAKGKNKRGPSLFGVVGRPAATVAGYKYSGALSQTGWTWDEATLRRYLAQPSDTALTGTKMEYEGLKDARQLDALIGYLRSRR